MRSLKKLVLTHTNNNFKYYVIFRSEKWANEEGFLNLRLRDLSESDWLKYFEYVINMNASGTYLRFLRYLYTIQIMRQGINNNQYITKFRWYNTASVVSTMFWPHNVYLIVSQMSRLQNLQVTLQLTISDKTGCCDNAVLKNDSRQFFFEWGDRKGQVFE